MIKKLLIFAAIAMLFVGLQAGTASANLVSNGSFQLGNSTTITDWTQSNPNNTEYILGPADGGAPAGVTTEVMLSTNGLGTDTQISQTIATTAGQSYIVSFWLANDLPDSASYFKALWNGSTAAETLTLMTSNGSLPNASLSNAFDYNEFQFEGVATGATTAIAFDFQNDNSFYHLTDVDASPTPIPPTVLLFGPALAGLFGLRSRKSTIA
jgi:hypothetical protein